MPSERAKRFVDFGIEEVLTTFDMGDEKMKNSKDQLCVEMTNAAVRIALTGAGEYFRVHDLEVTDCRANQLKEALRLVMCDSVVSALADAKQAVEANMPEVAVQTFSVTMRLVGIQAAKSCST